MLFLPFNLWGYIPPKKYVSYVFYERSLKIGFSLHKHCANLSQNIDLFCGGRKNSFVRFLRVTFFLGGIGDFRLHKSGLDKPTKNVLS